MRSIIENIPGVMKLARKAKRVLRSHVPAARAILDFHSAHGYLPNVIWPKTFNEKVVCKRIYDRRDILVRFSDKVRAREYVAERLATDENLVPLFSVHSDSRSISLGNLPNEFVMKANHGSGWVRIYERGTSKNIVEIRELADSWLRQSYFTHTQEWCYKNIKPLVMFEKYISVNGKLPDDIKIFCFAGQPVFIQLIRDRFGQQPSEAYYDKEWRRLPFQRLRPSMEEVDAPPTLEKMLDIARKLSEGIDFVRVDLYSTNDAVYFGELTNYPHGGLGKFHPPEWDLEFGRHWRTLNMLAWWTPA